MKGRKTVPIALAVLVFVFGAFLLSHLPRRAQTPAAVVQIDVENVPPPIVRTLRRAPPAYFEFRQNKAAVAVSASFRQSQVGAEELVNYSQSTPAASRAASGPPFVATTLAQNRSGERRLDPKPGASKVRIEGTSTIHDWQIEGAVIGGHLEAGQSFPIEPGQHVKQGKADARAEVFIPVRSLKSVDRDGNPFSEKMNEMVYDHLKQPNNPLIYYRTSELVLRDAPNSKESRYLFDSNGELIIAGVTNSISMPITVTPLGSQTVRITGSTDLKMTSFGVEPPIILQAGLRSSDEVRLSFEWTVYPKPDSAGSKKSNAEAQRVQRDAETEPF